MTAVSPSFPMMDLFPQEHYGKDKSLIPHFLIARHNDPAKICQYMDKHPGSLEARDANGLTPFAVACMSGNAIMADLLLKRRANPLPLDKHRWTPLHYTYLTQNEALAQKIQAAVVRRRDLPNLEPIKQVLVPPLPQRSDVQVGWLQTRKGLIPLSQTHFKQLTGTLSKRDLFATRHSLIEYWVRGETPLPYEIGLPIYSQLNELYDAHLDDKVHYLTLKIAGRRKFQVLAAQKILPFRVIGLHGGKLSPLMPNEVIPDDAHRFGDIDASDVSNLTAMARDGLPNCIIHTVYQGGLPHHLLYSSDLLDAGEEICLDYGPNHTCKFHFRHFPSKTTASYENNSPRQLWEQLRSTPPTRPLEIEAIRAKLRYLFNTPYLLLQLLKEGKIDPAEVSAVLENPRIVSLLEIDEKSSVVYKIIIDAWATLDLLSPDLKQRALFNVFQFVETQPIHIVSQFFLELPNFLEGVDSVELWENAFQILNENGIAHDILYDWLKEGDDDAEAFCAFRAIHPRSRNSFYANMEAIAKTKYPERQASLRLMRAKSELIDWLKTDEFSPTLIGALLKLEFSQMEILRVQYRRHVVHKYPDRVDAFDDLMNSILPRHSRSAMSSSAD